MRGDNCTWYEQGPCSLQSLGMLLSGGDKNAQLISPHNREAKWSSGIRKWSDALSSQLMRRSKNAKKNLCMHVSFSIQMLQSFRPIRKQLAFYHSLLKVPTSGEFQWTCKINKKKSERERERQSLHLCKCVSSVLDIIALLTLLCLSLNLYYLFLGRHTHAVLPVTFFLPDQRAQAFKETNALALALTWSRLVCSSLLLSILVSAFFFFLFSPVRGERGEK